MLNVIGINRSPFVRKVTMTLEEKRVDYKLIEATPTDSLETIIQYNPLGKIPVLLDGNITVYDSTLILEYINQKFPSKKVFPSQVKEKLQMKQIESLVDELTDIAMQMFQRKNMPEYGNVDWKIAQENKIERTLNYLDLYCRKNVNEKAQQINIDVISICTFLSWLSFRLPEISWSDNRQFLRTVFKEIEKKEAFINTKWSNGG